MSGPKFTGLFALNAGGIGVGHIIRCLCDFGYLDIRSGDIRGRSLKLFEIASNFARIWLDQVAEFHVDRPRELGDLVVKKRNISSKT